VKAFGELPVGQAEDWALDPSNARPVAARVPAPPDFSGERADWWSRGESNPRPQALRSKIYVRSHVY